MMVRSAMLVREVLTCRINSLKMQVVASTITAMPRLTKAATFVAAGTVAILLSGPPALAADLILGEEVFNNNCGEKGEPVYSQLPRIGAKPVHATL